MDAEDLAKCFTLNGNGVPDICELEPGKQNASDDDAAPVFVDASNYYRANKHDIEKDSYKIIGAWGGLDSTNGRAYTNLKKDWFL